MAAALGEDQSYGLSCGSLNNGANVSVFHVKLTDSAARAFDSYQDCKGLSAQPSIRFTGNQGRIAIPRSESENASEPETFTFYLTNVGRDNPQSSFDLLHQHRTDGVEAELLCVGVIQQKMTVNATDDSYQKARQSLAQVEEETRSRAAIVIKPGGRFIGKRVKVRPPAACLTDAAAASRHSSRPVLITGRKGAIKLKGAAASEGPGERAWTSRSLRERLTHLLALRPYRRAELLLRLQKDGLTGHDRDMLDSLLLQVGQLSSRDSTYTLKDGIYKELQRDWAGYTTGDQQLLKRILVRRLFQPQNLLSVPETQVSPLRDTPNSSPAQRYSVAEEYTDPLANKKPRISHLSGKPIDGRRGPSPSGRREADHRARGAAATEDGGCGGVTSSDPRPPSEPSSEAATRDGQAPSTGAGSVAHPPPRPPPAPPQKLPDAGRRSRDSRRSKHRQRGEGLAGADGRGGGNVHSLKHRERNGTSCDASVLPVANDRTDYLLKYTEICDREQRLSYKQDFSVEYQEYLGLHARIDGVTRQFTQLDAQLKQLRHGSHRYQRIHNQILQEYRKIKKSNPNYRQDKTRCEYLHNKLAHIKRLISQYDQQQLRN